MIERHALDLTNVRDHEHILKQYYMELLWKIVKYVYSDMVTWIKFEGGGWETAMKEGGSLLVPHDVEKPCILPSCIIVMYNV